MSVGHLAMFMNFRMTTESAFHDLRGGIICSLVYQNHIILMHYPSFILMTGADLMAVVDGRIDFLAMLVRKRRHASQTGKVLLEVSEF
ncbi:MAG: hypothetical protein KME11_23085, partial [Timaviella obliquedivisa GSE-PSE-MK23-08B]|jgi:hypothetical protein|nr:hypothetical protein [Timaviella obliquedivisa GSE-PSE-MK23-08B]